MLKLTDLIQMAGINLADYKIHCATGLNSSPLEAFFDGRWKEWQEEQNQKNFECDQILSLIQLDGSRWLFAGVFEVLGVKKGSRHNPEGYRYSTRELRGLEHLTGRAIVRFEKQFRASYLIGSKYADKMHVVGLHEHRMSVGDFPGFNAVLLSHAKLKTVVRENTESWRAALGNVAGVYIITDNSTGKQYVGSAYGGDGIWRRWCAYAKNGHGGNAELRTLLNDQGADHADNFQYSILEVCDLNASDEFTLARESHWKSVLRTREYGLNSN
jgi:hypothetical protein